MEALLDWYITKKGIHNTGFCAVIRRNVSQILHTHKERGVEGEIKEKGWEECNNELKKALTA